jgi:hypothetical protein
MAQRLIMSLQIDLIFYMKSLQTITTFVSLLAMTIFTYNLNAQVEDTETVSLTANLQTSLALTLGTSSVDFIFNTVDQYNNGIGSTGNIFHTATVNSTSNWELEIKAQDDLIHTNGNDEIHLNQVGVSASLEGNYGSNRIINSTSLTAPLSLTKTKQVLLTKGNDTNAGNASDNLFNIYWQMGTQQTGMNNISILQQDYKKGIYSTAVDFILSEII